MRYGFRLPVRRISYWLTSLSSGIYAPVDGAIIYPGIFDPLEGCSSLHHAWDKRVAPVLVPLYEVHEIPAVSRDVYHVDALVLARVGKFPCHLDCGRTEFGTIDGSHDNLQQQKKY